MMALKSKLKKKSNIFILVIAIALIVGVGAFVLAYGLTLGWAEVLAWFGSKYAVLLYIALGLFVSLIIWFVVKDKVNKIG